MAAPSTTLVYRCHAEPAGGSYHVGTDGRMIVSTNTVTLCGYTTVTFAP
jgi:hypothetical protein